MPNFWTTVRKVINEADVLLMILDARLIQETRNQELEDKIKHKPFIYVFTKCDLVDKSLLEKQKKLFTPSVFVSAKEFHGVKILRERILIEAKKRYGEQKEYTIGVLGYPNVGKSSLINAMKGKSSAGVSSQSGHTRGVQKIRATSRIVFLDTPGVIPYKEDDKIKHAITASLDASKVKDPDLAVLELLNQFPGKIENYFQIAINKDKEKTIEEIAKKENLLKKGAQPDIERTSRMILKRWQKGDII